MKIARTVLIALLLAAPLAQAQETATAPPQAAEEVLSPEAQRAKYEAEAKAFYDSLDRKTGAIQIVDGKVTLTVPESHYFVGAADSRRIIVDTWGNPPEAAEGVEGMIFAREGNPMLDSWGAVVTYQNDGHVSDDDATKIDYAKLLADMQKETREANTARKEAGYGEVELVGWAETPHYDGGAKKLYWAKTLQFAGAPAQTLNYDIRVLGRDGVLVVSFISGMDALEAIHTAAPTVLAMPSFAEGARYADYKPGVDKKAAYGIAGLIAGGAALALVKKAGLLGLILAFGKKFLVLIGIGVAALVNMFRRATGGKKDAE